jgi:hypothetical protein
MQISTHPERDFFTVVPPKVLLIVLLVLYCHAAGALRPLLPRKNAVDAR